MNNDNTIAVSGGIGFLGLLTIAFIVLRLTHLIMWSWWWVFAPIWIPIAGVILFFIVIVFLLNRR